MRIVMCGEDMKTLFAFLICAAFLNPAVDGVRPLVLSCDDDDDVIEEIQQTRLERGFPGKAGARGPPGERGLKGFRGEKGDGAAVIPQELIEKINEVDQLLLSLQTVTTTLQELQEKVNNLEQGMGVPGTRPREKLQDCRDVEREVSSQSGLYNITIDGRVVTVYCDMQTDGGKWLVIQRRQDGSVDFYRNWDDYVTGFGNKLGEFWLGLENIHQITSSGNYELRIDLEDWNGNTAFAKYRSKSLLVLWLAEAYSTKDLQTLPKQDARDSVFSVGDASSNYILQVRGYSGNANAEGDSFADNNNQQFSTKDRDNDEGNISSCAEQRHGAWWYWHCTWSNLNGRYYNNGQTDSDGVTWYHWKSSYYSLKSADMKIRPK